jgi:ribosomal protein S6--L-glutamate ligase
MTRIGVVGIGGRWSTDRLLDAVEARTGHRVLVEPSRLAMSMEEDWARAGDVDLMDLDAIVIRKIGGSYSPEFLDRLEFLRYVHERGVPVFSDPRAIGRVLDRLTCTVTLRLNDIPMPPTVITEDPLEAAEAVERFGRAVLKPLFSTKARGMEVIESSPTTLEEVQAYQQDGHPFLYVQCMLDLPGRDLGVAFLGGEYLGTYARVREPGSWNTTIRSGGRYRDHEPSAEIVELARRAQAPFGLDLTCVDVAECEGGPVVFEVSAFGGFRGLHEGSGIDAASRLTEYVLARIRDD